MNTNEISVLSPNYFDGFSCLGDECPDHCCHSWTVSVDKSTYKKLNKHGDIEIKEIANDQMKFKRKSENHWAEIKMKDDGDCPVLDEKGLCKIQKKAGHNLLPKTCQIYPRTANWFGDYVEMSLFLSCPKVTEDVLFDTDAFNFNSDIKALDKINFGDTGGLIENELPQWLPAVRDFAFAIVEDSDEDLNVRLFTLGMFLKQASNNLQDLEAIESLKQSVASMYNSGEIKQMFSSLPNVAQLGFTVFSEQDKMLVKDTNFYGARENTGGLSNSSARFEDCREQFLQQLKSLSSENQSSEQTKNNEKDVFGDDASFARILAEANDTYLSSFLKNNGHLLTNYVLYYLYHYQFLAGENKSPYEFFKIMVVDLFMLKCYLSGIALTQGGLSKEWIVQLFQSYARRRQHNHGFVERMEETLEKSGTNSAGAIFGLLKL